RESEDRYRTLLENVGEGIGFVNPEEQFGYTNAASEDIFGVPPSGLLGRSLHEFANSEQFGLIREQTKRHRAGEKSVYEIEISRPSGENRDLLVTAVPQFDSQGKFVGALGVFRDITDRKRLEQEMAKARADFLFAVSHELKTPLFLMASAQELLESLPEEQRAGRFLEYGEIWNRNLHRLRHLIENLVDSQRTEGMGLKITLVPTNISETLQQTLKDVELLARRQRISFRLHLDPLPEIPADPESIHRLFENLLTNAIKFSPADGEVQVSLTLQGEEVLFRVSDFGLGIAASEISQLFQPFQRTSGANQAVIPGTGLGLYTAKLIAEAHSGSIALESEEGQGTTVVVRLPLHPGIIGT
ncbi:MAG: ATP-binding protein, partial [bacterium]